MATPDTIIVSDDDASTNAVCSPRRARLDPDVEKVMLGLMDSTKPSRKRKRTESKFPSFLVTVYCFRFWSLANNKA